MVDEGLDHGRHEQSVGHAVHGDGVEYRLRLEPGDDDVGDADQRAAEPAGLVGGVEHRRGVQVGASGRHELAGGGAAHRRRHQVRVAEHHAFGEAGGAARVEEAGQAVAAAADVGDGGGRGQEVLVGEHPVGRGAVADVDHGPQLGALLPERRDVRRQGVVDQQDAGVGVVQAVRHLLGAPPGVDRVQDRIGPRHPEQVLEVAVAVERQDRDAVTAGHAEGVQRVGQSGDAVAELGEGALTIPADRGDPIRRLHQRPMQALGDVHHGPPVAASPRVAAV